MEKDAHISACGAYRFALTRKWSEGKRALFIMLNPSTADATDDDPTIRRCISYARSWGYGSLVIGNLFAFRTPLPAQLKQVIDPVGAQNDVWLAKLNADADLVIAAWGNDGRYKNRSKFVRPLLTNVHFLRLTKLGEPSHPLYLPADLQPILWD